VTETRIAPPAQATPSAAATQTTSSRQLPRVQPYVLPLADLDQVAQGSGLQWVNSDMDKVATVQAAIAAEPKPIHVPRERPAPVVIDEGPLILVETRRDLRTVTLPFEQGSAQ
jgi:ribonuclease E